MSRVFNRSHHTCHQPDSTDGHTAPPIFAESKPSRYDSAVELRPFHQPPHDYDSGHDHDRGPLYSFERAGTGLSEACVEN